MTTSTLPPGTEILARTNTYPGTCVRCSTRVDAGLGLLARANGRWAAAHLIDECPEAPAPAAARVQLANEDGIYRTDDGSIYKVQVARQGSGRLYAKRLVVTACPGCDRCDQIDGQHRKGHFTYAPGIVHTLTAEQRLSTDEAAKYGRLYSVCVCCGADLTDETSIARGIGPICAGKYF